MATDADLKEVSKICSGSLPGTLMNGGDLYELAKILDIPILK